MSQIENLQQNGETPCPLCDDPERKCNYKFPSFDDFERYGNFSHVNPPFSDSEELPQDLLEFIYGDHYNGGAGVKPDHDAHIRRELNKMFENSFKSVFD